MSYCFGLRSSNWSQSGAFQVTPGIFVDDRQAPWVSDADVRQQNHFIDQLFDLAA